MHALECQGNGKHYVSSVFGYSRGITATDDNKRYLEGIYKLYWIVWDSEKKRLTEGVPVTANIDIELHYVKRED